MAECRFYKVETRHIESKEIRADRQRDVITVRLPWCSHPKHSPVPREIATGTVGGAHHLRCEGSLAKCPLSPDQLKDV